ncbi:DUF4829 domain-containing protein [Neobacillus piezotolerans]|uniref:DUF4829 domain-containing protein n=1 Tax=Neobacillus piezotolerans TaxID=2259171 RepID=UPI001CA4063F|nr:DUF4829 domain-containing protein [Neobacillus piezotolerans]
MIAGLVLAVFALLFYTQIGKTHNVKVTIEKSEKYTTTEIEDAVKAVKRKFWNFKGGELMELWYSEKESNAHIEGYMKSGRGASNGVEPENVIVLFSNFKVRSWGADATLEPNSTHTGWSWIVIRDSKTDKWRVDDWGY